MNPGFTPGYWAGLFGWLTLEAAVLVGFVAVASRILRPPGLRLAVWQVAILGLGGVIVCEVVGFESPRRPTTETADMLSVRQMQRPLPRESQPAEWPVEAVSLESPVLQPVSDPVAPRAPETYLWPLVLWGGGSLVLMLGSMVAQLRLGWRTRNCRLVSDASVVQQVAGIGTALGFTRPVRLCVDTRLRGPVAFGVWRPTIVLPANFTQRFAATQREAMLAHEIAHLAGKDPLWMTLANFVVALWWWHPLAWWARRQLRVHSELLADQASSVVENGPTALAESLVIL